MADIKNILNQIKNLNDCIDVYIPSMHKTVEMRQLSIKQCKDLINMPQNILHAQYVFFRKIYNIIKENTVSEDVKNFNIIDRVAIIIALRAKALNTYKDCNLSDVIPLINNIPYDLIEPTITTNNYIFTVKIPTIQSEDIFNKHIINTYKFSKNTPSLDEIETMSQEIFGDLTVLEICKYITNINLVKDDINVNMEELSPTQRKEIIENIKTEDLQKVIEFNNKVHAVETNFTQYNIGEKKLQIDIGPDFFIFI